MKKALNENVKELRMQCGLNQVEFAQKMNVTKQCVSNWENDNVLPSIEMLVKMADFFKKNEVFLVNHRCANAFLFAKCTQTML